MKTPMIARKSMSAKKNKSGSSPCTMRYTASLTSVLEAKLRVLCHAAGRAFPQGLGEVIDAVCNDRLSSRRRVRACS